MEVCFMPDEDLAGQGCDPSIYAEECLATVNATVTDPVGHTLDVRTPSPEEVSEPYKMARSLLFWFEVPTNTGM